MTKPQVPQILGPRLLTIQSPAWMLASGIGDALATYIEAQASFANNNVCNSGLDDYHPSMLGMAAAKLCYDILLKDGVAAMRAARQHLRICPLRQIFSLWKLVPPQTNSMPCIQDTGPSTWRIHSRTPDKNRLFFYFSAFYNFYINS